MGINVYAHIQRRDSRLRIVGLVLVMVDTHRHVAIRECAALHANGEFA